MGVVAKGEEGGSPYHRLHLQQMIQFCTEKRKRRGKEEGREEATQEKGVASTTQPKIIISMQEIAGFSLSSFIFRIPPPTRMKQP